MVAFWKVAPFCASDTEFHFDDAFPFQNLFCAVMQLCGLDGKAAETGFDLPSIGGSGQDEDDGEEA